MDAPVSLGIRPDPTGPRRGSLQNRGNPAIGGGRPPAEGDSGNDIPSGIDRLLRQAARDPQLRAELLAWRRRAGGYEASVLIAARAGIILTPEEVALLKAAPADQLAFLFDNMTKEEASDGVSESKVPEGQFVLAPSSYPAETGIDPRFEPDYPLITGIDPYYERRGTRLRLAWIAVLLGLLAFVLWWLL